MHHPMENLLHMRPDLSQLLPPSILILCTYYIRTEMHVFSKMSAMAKINEFPTCILDTFILLQLFLPLVLASSTKIISSSKWGGDLFITLCTVRSNVDQASL